MTDLPSVRRFFAVVPLLVAALGLPAGGRAADGQALFIQRCAMCHGAEGRAQTPIAKKLGVKDLSVSRLDDVALARQIRKGAKNAGGQTLMPAAGDTLSGAEYAALVEFVRGLRKAPPAP